MTRSLGEIRRHIPNIAAALGMSEEQVREQLGNAQAMMLEQRPSTEPFQMTFGGPEAFRSAAKSCLVLWALKVGNEEVRSEPYAAIRNYILNDDPSFIRTRTNLDTRVSEAAESIKQAYGPIFNFIYIRSDGAGRVVGHFTIFNLIASQVVLAESGGTPSQTIGLVSNPLNPRDWSDSAASMFDVPFDWLNCPSYDLDQARARFVALHESYRKIYGPQPIAKMSDAVFTKYGLGPNDRIPEDIFEQAVNELIQRIGYYMAGVPYQSVVTPDELRNAINELGSNKETD